MDLPPSENPIATLHRQFAHIQGDAALLRGVMSVGSSELWVALELHAEALYESSVVFYNTMLGLGRLSMLPAAQELVTTAIAIRTASDRCSWDDLTIAVEQQANRAQAMRALLNGHRTAALPADSPIAIFDGLFTEMQGMHEAVTRMAFDREGALLEEAVLLAQGLARYAALLAKSAEENELPEMDAPIADLRSCVDHMLSASAANETTLVMHWLGRSSEFMDTIVNHITTRAAQGVESVAVRQARAVVAGLSLNLLDF